MFEVYRLKNTWSLITNKSFKLTPSLNFINLLFTLFVVACSLQSASAQDLILTTHGDSLKCYVTAEKTDSIYFLTSTPDSVSIQKSVIARKNIKSIQRNFFGRSKPSENIPEKNPSFEGLMRYALSGGYSRRLAPTQDDLPHSQIEYLDRLKNGYHLNLDITYYWNPNNGLGLHYSVFRAKNSGDILIMQPDTTVVIVFVSDDVIIQSIGVNYSLKYPVGKKDDELMLQVGLNYVSYTDHFYALFNGTTRASTLGLNLGFNYDLKLTNRFSATFGLGFQMGYYENYSIDLPNGQSKKMNFEKNAGDNLTRLDLSVGIAFR